MKPKKPNKSQGRVKKGPKAEASKRPKDLDRKVDEEFKKIMSEWEAKLDAQDAEMEEILRDSEITVEAKLWHQLSQSQGGIYAVQEKPDVKSFKDQAFDHENPIWILSYDELVERYGEDDASGMANACVSLSIEDQIELARECLKSPSLQPVSMTVKRVLAAEGIKVK